MGNGRLEIVTGDANEPAQPLVAGRQDGLDRTGPRVELGEVGDRVQLVEVEPVTAEEAQGLLQLSPDVVGTVVEGLARDEELVAHCRNERPERFLRPAVLGGDVEVVDPGGERRRERRAGRLGVAVPEGRTSEDGHRRVVTGTAEPPLFHEDSPLAIRPQPAEAASRAASHAVSMVPKCIGL